MIYPCHASILSQFTLLQNPRRFDPDNEGFVSLDELKFVMSNLPVRVSEEEVEEMVRAVDVGR